MGKALFYHLTRDPVEVTLTKLAGLAMGQGWNVLVRSRDAGRIDWLDQKLWLMGGDESFLPHGVSGGLNDAEQPILLTADDGNANGAVYVMSLDGAEISAEEVAKAERGVILFDGHDPDAVAHARVQWKTLTDAGCAAEYWSEETGRWEKKAEKAAV